MTYKFSKISGLDLYERKKRLILKKEFSANVYSAEEMTRRNGEKYIKFLLKQGKSKIAALAFGWAYEKLKNLLQPSKKTIIKFPRDTFSCEKRNKKIKSDSTCEYELFFQFGSKFLREVESIPNTTQVGNTDSEPCTLQGVLSELIKSSQTVTKKLKSIKFNDGKIYRYWGCENCCFSIPRKHPDGRFYCKGTCNNKKARKSKIGVVTQRKICFTIYDLKLSDDTNETIESVVVFNRVCEKLLRKNGCDFITDESAVEAWQELIARSRFDITLKRDKKRKCSQYVPSLIVTEVHNVVQQDAKLFAAAEIDDNVEYDGPWPDFLEFEMKLQSSADPCERHWAREYQISSRPPGLVLLINNYYYPNSEERERRGSEIDIALLQTGFVEMGYKIYRDECQMDIKTKEAFRSLIIDFKRQLIDDEVDSIFIIISSHGVNLGIELADGDCINVVEELMIPFSDDHFPEYQGKPKVFMPLVCQNIGGHDYRASPDDQANQLFDMLICCPTLPGFAQNRITNKGTLYVNLLMSNLMNYARSMDFVEILKKVQYDLKHQIESRELLKWTVPHYYGIVFRPFYLIPKTTG